jgi:HEAT repeat protein/beta-lactamase regulating signal transducer with metallopeptidase domain
MWLADFTAHWGETSWLDFGFGVFLKGTLVLIAALVLTLLLRRASASARHLIWTSAFACLVALPFASMMLPEWSVPLVFSPVSKSPVDVGEPIDVARHEVEPTDIEASPHRETLSSKSLEANFVTKPARWSWRGVTFVVWSAGTLTILLRLALGFVLSHVLTLRAKTVTDENWTHLVHRLGRSLGLKQTVPILQTNRSMVPITSGIMRPKVLLPTGADDWSEERRRSVLLHELAHVRRRDCLVQLLTQLACAIYWWNPLVWHASRQLRQESERACDDLVLDGGTRASDYAHDLLEMARALNETRRSPLASAALAHRSRFEDRLLAILDPKLARYALGRASTLSAILVTSALLVPLAALQPTTRAEREDPDAPAESTAIAARFSWASIEERAEQTEARGAQEVEVEPVSTSSAQAEVDKAQDPTPSPQPAPQSQADDPGVNNDKALSALVGALNDPEPSVREQAISVLGELRYEPAAESLVQSLLDTEPAIREKAAWALGMIRYENALEPLSAALGDEDDSVREQAAWALGMTRDERGVEALLRAARDTRPNVREQAVWSLGMIQDERATESLVAALRDEDPDVREQAAWALGMARSSRAVEGLTAALEDEDSDVREQAAWALGMIRDERATTALGGALKDEDSDVREQAAWALGMLRSESAVNALIESLHDEDPDVREQAAWALGMIRDPLAKDALTAALQDEDPDVREQATWALGMLAWRNEII